MKFIIRVLINAVALWLTALLLPAINLTANPWGILIVALIFGLVNALIRPIVKLLSLPITLITLGLFTLVINTAMLMLTALFAGSLLDIAGGIFQQFGWACLASIVISLISTVINWLFKD